MLFGTDAWEVNCSHPRGFFTVCAGCGTNHRIEVYPELSNLYTVEGCESIITGAHQMYVIIECKECGQVVRINPDQTSEILKESDYSGE